jgi:hypothetical protein
MAGKRDIEAASAYVRLYTRGNEWAKGLKSAGKSLEDFGTKINAMSIRLAAAGAALSAPIIASVKAYIDLGSELDDVSQRIGINVKALSELRYAADLTGSNITDLEKAFRKAGIATDKEFEKIADAIAAIEDPAERTAAAMKKFGKSGASLVPLLSMGSKGIQQFREQAEFLGLSMTGEQAAGAAALGDSLDILLKSIQRLSFEIGAALQPALQDLAAWTVAAIKSAVKWISENKEAVVVVAKVAAGTLVAAGAMTAFGTSVLIAGVSLKAMGVALGAVTSAFALLRTIATLSVFSIVNPLNVALALLGGLAAYGLYASGIIKKLGEMFSAAGALMQKTWAGFLAAIASGDLELAGEIAIGSIEVLWETAIISMSEVWDEFVSYLSEGRFAIDMFKGIEDAFEYSLGGMRLAWAEFANFFGFDTDIENNKAKIFAGMAQGLGQNEDTAAFFRARLPAKGERPPNAALEARRMQLSDKIQELADNVQKAGTLPGVAALTLPGLPTSNMAGALGGGTKTAGIFQAGAVRSLGVENIQQQIAKNTAETAANTKRFVHIGKFK